jgi:hypothetical protein
MGRFRGAGATGLEPATSGVTGRADRNAARRRSNAFTLQTTQFRTASRQRFPWLWGMSPGRLGHYWARAAHSTLHSAEDRKVFDKVVVITDRVILGPPVTGTRSTSSSTPVA